MQDCRRADEGFTSRVARQRAIKPLMKADIPPEPDLFRKGNFGIDANQQRICLQWGGHPENPGR